MLIICTLVIATVAYSLVFYAHQSQMPTVSSKGLPEEIKKAVLSSIVQGATDIHWNHIRFSQESILVFCSYTVRDPKADFRADRYLGMDLFKLAQRRQFISVAGGALRIDPDAPLTVLLGELLPLDPFVSQDSPGLFAGGYIRDKRVAKVVGWSTTGESAEAIPEDGFFWVQIDSANQSIHWDRLDALDAQGNVLYTRNARTR